MKNLSALGRILFALPFGILGINHFLMIDFYIGMLTSFVPGGGFTIIFIGIVLILASICIIIKKFIPLICWILAALLFLFIVSIHIPHILYETDIYKSKDAIIELFKDTSLMGGAIMIAAFYKEKKSKIL
jgi:putative oxidoreductase